MNEMTPQECAEQLENRAKRYHPSDKITAAMNQAAAVMRKLAAGELAEVVHCKDCERRQHMCGNAYQIRNDFYCANGKRKDDNNATD